VLRRIRFWWHPGPRALEIMISCCLPPTANGDSSVRTADLRGWASKTSLRNSCRAKARRVLARLDTQSVSSNRSIGNPTQDNSEEMAEPTSNPRLRALRLVKSREKLLQTGPTWFGFDRATLDAAMTRLTARVGEADATNFFLRRRTPRWRIPPSGNLVGAPVVDADDVEIAIVALLAATANQWQFSSTPDGQMFTGMKRGYHREAERLYVTGLSEVIDTAAGRVESHRAGAGGRVYITKGFVECAECQLIIAWINKVGSRRTAFRKCSAVAARATSAEMRSDRCSSCKSRGVTLWQEEGRLVCASCRTATRAAARRRPAP